LSSRSSYLRTRNVLLARFSLPSIEARASSESSVTTIPHPGNQAKGRFVLGEAMPIQYRPESQA
jgi:hypothetical protein